MSQTVKNLPAVQGMQVWYLGQRDPLQKGIATHSSILAWRIPRTEDPDWLQRVGLQRVGHDWATKHPPTHIFIPVKQKQVSSWPWPWILEPTKQNKRWSPRPSYSSYPVVLISVVPGPVPLASPGKVLKAGKVLASPGEGGAQPFAGQHALQVILISLRSENHS